MSRTDNEILARIEAVKAHDWLGTQTGDLVSVLSFAAASPFLREDVLASEWEPESRDHREVEARMLAYMPFAWGKANGCRGLSAGRSLEHMSVWLWLLGHDEAADSIADYDRYGKPQLRAICEAFGWDWRQWDDGDWRNNEDGPNLGVPGSVPPLILSARSNRGEEDNG